MAAVGSATVSSAGVDEALVGAVDHYLSGLGCTLWGRSFDVISRGGREEAAAWLTNQIVGVLAAIEQQEETDHRA